MLKLTLGIMALTLSTVSFSAQATHIEDFLDQDPPHTAYYHCAFKQKIGSQKCKVTLTEERITDPKSKHIFGPGTYPVLKIYWPDKDISRYVLTGSYELYNLGSRSYGFSFRTSEYEVVDIDFSKGLIIDQDGKEYIRLW